MSLAMYAAPFDNDNNTDQINNKDNDNHINKKRTTANKTQKRYPKENNNSTNSKVNSVLQTIHNSTEQDEGLADFNPLPPPSSAGVENTRYKEQYSQHNTPPSALPYSNSEQNDNHMSSDHTNDLMNQTGQSHVYNKNMNDVNKRFNPNNLPYGTTAYPQSQTSGYPQYQYQQQQQQYSEPNSNYDVMLEKLNYMINLLEEQKDGRTNNVTEEVVLYSFLGIFIIFVVDSFARVGKYTR